MCIRDRFHTLKCLGPSIVGIGRHAQLVPLEHRDGEGNDQVAPNNCLGQRQHRRDLGSPRGRGHAEQNVQ
eukprot:5312916-Alexandrium_andersonii.AAC.1